MSNELRSFFGDFYKDRIEPFVKYTTILSLVFVGVLRLLIYAIQKIVSYFGLHVNVQTDDAVINTGCVILILLAGLIDLATFVFVNKSAVLIKDLTASNEDNKNEIIDSINVVLNKAENIDVLDAGYRNCGIIYNNRLFEISLQGLVESKSIFEIYQEAVFKIDREIHQGNILNFVVSSYQYPLVNQDHAIISNSIKGSNGLKNKHKKRNCYVDSSRTLAVFNNENILFREFIYDVSFKLYNSTSPKEQEYETELTYFTYKNLETDFFAIKVLSPTRRIEIILNGNNDFKFKDRSIQIYRVSFNNWNIDNREEVEIEYTNFEKGKTNDNITVILQNPPRGYIYLIKYELVQKDSSNEK
jgi:hypothetical protein